MVPAKNENPAVDWGTQRPGGLAWRTSYKAKTPMNPHFWIIKLLQIFIRMNALRTPDMSY